MRVGLRGRRRIGTHRRAQAAEARHRVHANAVPRQRADKCQALVVLATAAVNHQQRGAGAGPLVLDRPEARGDQWVAHRDAGGGRRDVGVETPPDQQGRRSDCQDSTVLDGCCPPDDTDPPNDTTVRPHAPAS